MRVDASSNYCRVFEMPFFFARFEFPAPFVFYQAAAFKPLLKGEENVDVSVALVKERVKEVLCLRKIYRPDRRYIVITEFNLVFEL